MKALSLLIFLSSILSAETVTTTPSYTWVVAPIEFSDQRGFAAYTGIIEDATGTYTAPTISYDGLLFDVDVTTFDYPSTGMIDFNVLTPAPEPVSLWLLLLGLFVFLLLRYIPGLNGEPLLNSQPRTSDLATVESGRFSK